MTRRTGTALLMALAVAACSPSQAAAPRPAPTPTPTPTPVAVASPTPAPTREAPQPITLAFAGDIHFEGAVRRHLLDDPRTVFGDMAGILEAADLTMANLETAITERGKAEVKQYVFRAPASAFTALRAAGIDVVTNANNHGMDYGSVGLQDTLAAARRARFPMVGSGQDEAEAYAPHVATVKGTRVALLGASQVIAPELIGKWAAGPHHPGIASGYDAARLTRAVRDARRLADLVVVYLHWGQERNSCPTGRQRTLARQLAEAGADIVVGSHAHVVQGSGRLGSTYVAYGLGNFLFYARGTGLSTKTSVLTLTVQRRTVTAVTRTPAVIRNGWTTPLQGPSAVREVARQDALERCAFG